MVDSDSGVRVMPGVDSVFWQFGVRVGTGVKYFFINLWCQQSQILFWYDNDKDLQVCFLVTRVTYTSSHTCTTPCNNLSQGSRKIIHSCPSVYIYNHHYGAWWLEVCIKPRIAKCISATSGSKIICLFYVQKFRLISIQQNCKISH